jgi:hypothetical protein
MMHTLLQEARQDLVMHPHCTYFEFIGALNRILSNNEQLRVAK